MSNTSSSPEAYPGAQFGLVFTNPDARDWLKSFTYKLPQNLLDLKATDSQTPAPTGEPYSQTVKDRLDYAKGYFPIWQQMQQSAAKASAESTRQQISDLFPYLSAASAEATARNLAASTKFLLTKEQTPTAQAARNVAAQSQITSSAGAEAERDRATAAQFLAAAQGPAKYSGTTFRMA
jgi:hypothetical protein